MIPYSRQEISEEDIAAAVEVLKSEFITQGETVGRFESALTSYTGTENAVAVSSGTAALHLACIALDLGPGDQLWTSPMTFVASANCARYCGADVDFVDVDPATGNMSVDALRAKLDQSNERGILPKIVVPVHFAGYPCDMESISKLATQYGFHVVEDAAHALGAYDNRGPVGHGAYSDITVFSFHPVKAITTGEGGAALSPNDAVAHRIRRLRSHGISRDPRDLTPAHPDPWYYEQVELGFNYRLTDIQAALGCSQLPRLEAWVRRRNELARRYDELLSGLPIATPPSPEAGRSAFHLYVIHITPDAGVSRATLFRQLRNAGIAANVHYIPVHLQPYYQKLGFRPGMYPAAENFYTTALSLPLFPGLTFSQQDQIVDKIREILP